MQLQLQKMDSNGLLRDTSSVPVRKLNKTTAFTHGYFNRDNLTKLQKWLSEIFVTDIRIKPSNKNLLT